MRFAILVVAMVFYSQTGHAAPASAEAWRLTTLDLDFTKKFINNEKCRSSTKYFESCYQAIEAASQVVGVRGEDDYPADYDFETKLATLTTSLPAEIPAQMVLGTALNTQLKLFDAHAYLRPAHDRISAAEQARVGLGFTAYKSRRGFLVNEVYPQSPASQAGLQFGDRIVAVGEEGQPLVNIATLSPDDLGKVLKGARGTVVQLEVERPSGECLILKARRDLSQRLPVEFSRMPQDPDIGYIRVRLFVPGYTCNQARLGFSQLTSLGAKSFILDLRGNPGGDFDEALCLSSLMTGLDDQIGLLNVPVTIPAPELIPIYNPTSEIVPYVGLTLNPTRRRLAVIMDEQAGSSSELVAGTLQTLKHAWIVGKQSFGKGTLQALEIVTGHPSLLLAATTKRVYFTNMKSHQLVGITPSFPVPTLLGLKDGELLEEREADLHPNALEAVNEPWEDERQTEIATIKECISEYKFDAYYLGRLGSIGPDYQRAYAAAVLKCTK